MLQVVQAFDREPIAEIPTDDADAVGHRSRKGSPGETRYALRDCAIDEADER